MEKELYREISNIKQAIEKFKKEKADLVIPENEDIFSRSAEAIIATFQLEQLEIRLADLQDIFDDLYRHI